VTESAPSIPLRVHVVGTGLVGTSAGLALRAAGAEVTLADRDARALALAADLGAGTAEFPEREPDVVLVAVPPNSAAEVVHAMSRLFLGSTLSDVTSVKSHVQVDVQSRLGSEAHRFVGGHPMAGRERSGPEAARADLFEGRAWVVTPSPDAEPGRVSSVVAVAAACGAVPVVMDAATHDRVVAVVSHLPQVAASLVAARLLDCDPQALALAGAGVRDVTRLAASDPELWVQILSSNAEAVADVLGELATDLARARGALAVIASTGDQSSAASPSGSFSGGSSLSLHIDKEGNPQDALLSILERGRAGRRLVAGKHGGPPTVFATVPVVVEDRPGELARLFVAAGDAGVNIEDVAIEHSPGQPVGLIELSVRPAAVPALVEALRTAGWSVHA
jgi:prephenate dehydrogenase